jgi:hypothetical protein
VILEKCIALKILRILNTKLPPKLRKGFLTGPKNDGLEIILQNNGVCGSEKGAFSYWNGQLNMNQNPLTREAIANIEQDLRGLGSMLNLGALASKRILLDCSFGLCRTQRSLNSFLEGEVTFDVGRPVLSNGIVVASRLCGFTITITGYYLECLNALLRTKFICDTNQN